MEKLDMCRRFALAFALLLMLVTAAQAHFVWLVVEKGESSEATANVYFAELAETDDAALLDKIAQVKVWTRGEGSSASPLKLTKEEHKDGGGAWVATLPSGSRQALSGTIMYGVLERRGDVFQLNYHAAYLDASSPEFNELRRDPKLPLEVVPTVAGENSKVEVLWQGKPAVGSEVVVVNPAGKQLEAVKTDDGGVAAIDLSRPGLYSIRAKWVVDAKGEEGGKAYEKANHYSTLALRVPAPMKAAPAAGNR
jgi:uncharacterized GH25 family protein